MHYGNSLRRCGVLSPLLLLLLTGCHRQPDALDGASGVASRKGIETALDETGPLRRENGETPAPVSVSVVAGRQNAPGQPLPAASAGSTDTTNRTGTATTGAPLSHAFVAPPPGTGTIPSPRVVNTTGPGLVICEPVGSGEAALTAFGAGCGRWLHLNVAGQGVCGRTCLWSALERVERELNRPNLQLSLDDAKKLTSMVGATHAAIGTISGDASHCTLSYQLVTLPDGKPVGSPLSISGTQAQVLAQLPNLAHRLGVALGLRGISLPAPVGVSPDEMRQMGEVPWFSEKPLPPAQAAALKTLAPHSSLAGVLWLKSAAQTAAADYIACRDALLKQADNNTLVLTQLGYVQTEETPTFQASLAGLLHAYPANYLVTMANVWHCRVTQNARGQEQASQTIVRIAPTNPDAWLTRGTTLANQAEAIRRSRTIPAMNEKEYAAISAIYPHWLQAVQEAVKRDPLHGRGWLRVATAASFNSQHALADKAIENAVKMQGDDPEVWFWGLQMYQPKWFGDPMKLRHIAERAAAQTFAWPTQTLYVAANIRDAGFPDLAAPVFARVTAAAQEVVRTNPNSSQAHYDLATALKDSLKNSEAAEEYEAVARLRPNDADAHYDLGMAYERAGRTGLKEYQTAVHLNPNHAGAHCRYGWLLKERKRYPEAEQELRAALRVSPNYAEAHMGLGDVLQAQKKSDLAIREYQTAARLSPRMPQVYNALCGLLADTHRNSEAIATGLEGIRYNSRDPAIYTTLAYAYALNKQHAESARMCRYALQIAPNDTTARENLSDALWELNQKEEVRAGWRAMAKVGGPAGQEAREMLAKHGQ